MRRTPPDAAEPTGWTGQFLRAEMYGCGAAFVGLVIWTLVQHFTGFQIGLLAIGIGWGIGTSIKYATKGHTRRKYQFLAVGLTYTAIAMSTLPLFFVEAGKQKEPTKQEQAKQAEEKKAESPAMAKAEEQPTAEGILIRLDVRRRFGRRLIKVSGLPDAGPFGGITAVISGGMGQSIGAIARGFAAVRGGAGETGRDLGVGRGTRD